MKKLIIIFIILNLLDCITTFIGLKMGLMEANLFLGFFMKHSIILGLAVKMALAGGVVLLLHLIKKMKLLKIVNIAFTVIVCWNVAMMGVSVLLANLI